MPPPPAEPFASRLFLGPALRTQPDRRLVTLVREGYETAFEEIVRRYRKPLDRFAAAIVGGRSEDVTQDAFSKALLALRGTDRGDRAAALALPDRPQHGAERPARPAAAGRGAGRGDRRAARSAADEAERREEIAELMERLRALPEPQRAAIVMRELEGLSHEEIAAALGVSGGAARQAIYRARLALRDGLGLLIPLPLLRMLFDHGAEAAGAGAGGAVAAAGAAAGAGGGGAALGGLGAAGALKVGVATALLAGSVGAGVAMQHDHGGRGGPEPAEAAVTQPTPGGAAVLADDSAGGSGSDSGSSSRSGEDRGHGGSGSERRQRTEPGRRRPCMGATTTPAIAPRAAPAGPRPERRFRARRPFRPWRAPGRRRPRRGRFGREPLGPPRLRRPERRDRREWVRRWPLGSVATAARTQARAAVAIPVAAAPARTAGSAAVATRGRRRIRLRPTTPRWRPVRPPPRTGAGRVRRRLRRKRLGERRLGLGRTIGPVAAPTIRDLRPRLGLWG